MAGYKDKVYTDKETGLKVFDMSYTEFINYCQQNEPLPENGRESSDKSDAKWTGTKSWQQAIEYARDGWVSGIEQLPDFIETDNQRITVEHDIVGHTVDVGRYLSGLPDSMVSFYDETYRDKQRLSLFVNLSYNCGVGGDTAMKYTKKIIQTVSLLSQSFNLKLVGVFRTYNHSGDCNNGLLTMVRIKESDERMVLNSLAFSFHPSFFRRFWFRLLETTPYWSSGYGSSTTSDFQNPEACKWGKTILSSLSYDEEAVFLPTVHDLSEFDPSEIYRSCVDQFIIRNKTY